MLRPKLFAGLLITCFLLVSSGIIAQPPTWTLDPFGKEKKPEKYEEKILPSEKTQDKKFGPVRRLLQNGTSHYNFYFNANQRLNTVVERARISNKDDYTKLLSFYPYSLDNTAGQKTDLDSVIYKATAGILLHDLRTSWVDNFYLLIGKAYFFKKDFDSAALTFQFINYNLYPRKKDDDDYNRVVGSNEASGNTNTSGAVSIADKENRNVLQKAFTLPPSRNDALIWQIRTFTEQKEYGDAAGLISILENDRNLPKRLKNDLDEVTAYWYYAQNNYDSASAHLAKALTNAESKEDKSRWEYLLAQLYEITGKYDAASQYYVKAARHTADPVMDIYSRLNEAKMMRNAGNFKDLDNSIANLLRMAKRDKYEAFRDVIYYSAAQLTLQRPDTGVGIGYYNKSIYYFDGKSAYRDRSFLQLANIAYSQHRYRDAQSYYDSLNLSSNVGDSAMIAERKEILDRLVPMLLAVERADSLQRIADMSPADRESFIRKLVRKYQKENGLKEDDDFAGNTLITFNDRNAKPVDLFAAAGANTGEWYFYNASLKSKGFNDFKSKWGKRTNVDNWRRKTVSEAAIGKNLNGNPDLDATIPQDGKGLVISQPDKPALYSYDAMMGNLPLSKEMRDSSDRTVAENLFNAAQVFQNELEAYPEAIALYDDFVRRFAQHEKLADVYYNLSYCWSKMGNKAKADYYRNLVQNNYAGSNAARMIANPNGQKTDAKNPVVTARYEGIYNMFIEGKFEQAVAAKRKADSSYGKNYWSPQLLYIESVYYIKARRDSEAVAVLKNIQQLYPTSPLKEKATTMIDVLSRRDSIERYLTALQVTRLEDEKIIFADENNNVKVAAPVTKPTEIKAPTVVTTKVTADSVKTPEIYVNKSFVLQPEKPHYVAMILNKVDGVYINEARNAFSRFNKESMATVNVAITKDALDADNALLLFAPFANAQDALKYFDRIKKAAPSEVSWLQASKYSFIIISDNNLQLLKTNKDISSYKQLLNTNFGNKF